MSAGGLICDNGCPPTMLLPSIGEVLSGSCCPIKYNPHAGLKLEFVLKPPTVKASGILLLLLTGDVLTGTCCQPVAQAFSVKFSSLVLFGFSFSK